MSHRRNTRLSTDPSTLDAEQKKLVRRAEAAHKKLTVHQEKSAKLIEDRNAAVGAAIEGGVGPALLANSLGLSRPIITRIARRSEAP